jgi:hypothetical protein
VVWACVLVWSFCTIAIVVLAGSVALVAARPSLVFDQLQKSNPDTVGGSMSRTELVNATYTTCGLAIVWAVVAIVLAVLAFRRTGWARTALMVSAAATVVLCLVAIFTSMVMVVPAAVAGASLALLSRPEVRAWYAAGRPPRDRRGPIRP